MGQQVARGKTWKRSLRTWPQPCKRIAERRLPGWLLLAPSVIEAR